MNGKIDAVLVDTSAFVRLNCDFCGVTHSVIPMFFELLSDNEIKLLTHPVLHGEIKKHIKESSLVTKVAELCDHFVKCRKQMDLISLSVERFASRSACSEIEEKLMSAYDLFFKDAVSLPIGDPFSVFDEYFSSTPPFQATGKKRSEFPDAFILRGLWEYCELNTQSNILVISDDGDWKNTIERYSNVTCVGSINEALNLLWSQLEYKDAYIASLLEKSKALITEEVEKIADGETYSLPEIGDLEEMDVHAVRVKEVQDYYTILDILDDRVIIQVAISLSVDGEAQFLDEDRSIWDSEDRCYLFAQYMEVQFKNAEAEVECEVTIHYPPNRAEEGITISGAKLVYNWDIELELDQDNTDYIEYDDRDDNDYDTEPISIKELAEKISF